MLNHIVKMFIILYGISWCYRFMLQERVAMIKNIHYSGVYGLMKLILTEALPDTVLQV